MALGIQSYSNLILMFYSDADFRARFIKDPTATLRDAGVIVPEGVTVKAVVDTRDIIHIVVPERHELHSGGGLGVGGIAARATQLPTDGCRI